MVVELEGEILMVSSVVRGLGDGVVVSLIMEVFVLFITLMSWLVVALGVLVVVGIADGESDLMAVVVAMGGEFFGK
jgi:hypothetical protein